jgi:hypothetical protein
MMVVSLSGRRAKAIILRYGRFGIKGVDTRTSQARMGLESGGKGRGRMRESGVVFLVSTFLSICFDAEVRSTAEIS